MKWLGLALLGAAGFLFFKKKSAGGGSATPGGGEDVDQPEFNAQMVMNLTPAQAARVAAFQEAWRAEDVPLAMQLALIANAKEESGIRLAVRSAEGLPDDAKGGAWTAFQILRPTVESAAARLGLSFAEVVPNEEPTGSNLRRIARNQARVALLAADGLNYRWDPRDPEMSAFDMFTRWAAGPSWPAARVLGTPAVSAVLGGRLPDDQHIAGAIQALRRQDLKISAGALEKLQHFREYRRLYPRV